MCIGWRNDTKDKSGCKYKSLSYKHPFLRNSRDFADEIKNQWIQKWRCSILTKNFWTCRCWNTHSYLGCHQIWRWNELEKMHLILQFKRLYSLENLARNIIIEKIFSNIFVVWIVHFIRLKKSTFCKMFVNS